MSREIAPQLHYDEQGNFVGPGGTYASPREAVGTQEARRRQQQIVDHVSDAANGVGKLVRFGFVLFATVVVGGFTLAAVFGASSGAALPLGIGVFAVYWFVRGSLRRRKR